MSSISPFASPGTAITLLITALVLLGVSGCVLVPAPVYPTPGYAVAAPVVVAPARPFVVVPGPVYRYRYGYWY
jgi:hypothetical protein